MTQDRPLPYVDAPDDPVRDAPSGQDAASTSPATAQRQGRLEARPALLVAGVQPVPAASPSIPPVPPGPPLSAVAPVPEAAPAQGGVSRWLRWLLGALLLVAVGAMLGIWARDRLPWVGTAAPSATPRGVSGDVGAAPVAGQRAATAMSSTRAVPPSAPVSDAAADPVPPVPDRVRLAGADARVYELERRIARLTAEADVASGNAARAEALLVAFGARRALDRGLPLGYLAEQLTVRFGDAQPNAVRSVLETGAEPVTLDDLRAGLDAAAPALHSFAGARDPLARLRLAVGSLVTARDADGRSVTVPARLDRARRHVDAGRVALAIAEVEAIPGARAAAAGWLAEARRFSEARRALDLIESAAILAPQGAGPITGLRASPAASTSGADADGDSR